MTTPTIEQIHKHASVRHYKPDPVDPDLVRTIVAAGQRAATSSNLQLYSAVAVTDVDKRVRLSEACGSQQSIVKAPVFVAWCADWSRIDRISQGRGYELNSDYLESLLVATVDVAILMQTATLAAESLGLGACYIGAIRNQPQAVIELLDLPKLTFPISGMTLGWPSGPSRLRPRLSPEAVLHWERYDPQAEEPLLKRFDQAMIDTGIYQGRQVPVPGQPQNVEDYGWQEHSARRASKAVRTELRQVVEQQGFGLK